MDLMEQFASTLLLVNPDFPMKAAEIMLQAKALGIDGFMQGHDHSAELLDFVDLLARLEKGSLEDGKEQPIQAG